MMSFRACLTAYEDVYASAHEALPVEISSAISCPEAAYAPPQYFEAPVRLMIIGQDSEANFVPLDPDRNPEEVALNQALLKAQFYDMEPAQRLANTSFWTGIDEAIEFFGLSGRKQIAWCNLIKVQRLQAVGASHSVAAGPPLYEDMRTTRRLIADWLRPLAQAEWQWLRPDAVICFAGAGKPWIRALFPEILEEIIGPRCLHPAHWENPGVPVFSTWPPEGRRRHEKNQ